VKINHFFFFLVPTDKPIIGNHEECICLLRLGKLSTRLKYQQKISHQWFHMCSTICKTTVECIYYDAELYFLSGQLKDAIKKARISIEISKKYPSIHEMDVTKKLLPTLLLQLNI
jgi:hypothetical protein